MKQKKLLKKAAKAVGLTIYGWLDGNHELWADINPEITELWNPLESTQQAMDIAIQLRLVIFIWKDGSAVSVARSLDNGDSPDDESDDWVIENTFDNITIDAALRKAIVRYAAINSNN